MDEDELTPEPIDALPNPMPVDEVFPRESVRTPGRTLVHMPLLRLGSVGGAVVTLQGALGIKSDGRFGPLTEKEVRAFQKRKRLKQTGVVDAETWDALA